MRQIITPLPKVVEKRNSTSPQPVKTSPRLISQEKLSINDISAREIAMIRRRSTGTPLGVQKRLSPSFSEPRNGTRRQSDAQDLSSGYSSPSSFDIAPPAIDPTNFSLYMSSLSSSQLPSNTYGLTVTDTINTESLDLALPMPMLNGDESLLVGFFLREVPSLLPFSELFPSICSDIWAMSVTHIPLTEAILAISSFLAERRPENQNIASFTYLEKALTRFQEVIAAEIVDEGLISGVFLLALLSTLGGDYKGARRHLQGMTQLLQLYHQRRSSYMPEESLASHISHYPIIMLLWRMAIRLEYHVAFYNSGQGPPIFSINNASQESAHIPWISRIVDKSLPNGVDWALAAFALDDLMNRAGHLWHKRSDNELSPIDQAFQLQDLVEEHQNWKRRPVIHDAIMENISSDTAVNLGVMQAENSARFLNYQPTHVSNKLYGTLLIRHFMTGIYLSLISDPCSGPVSPERFQSAVDICRYFVALYGDPPYTHDDPLLRPVDNCMALISAGITFREDTYPNEFEFCIQALSEIAHETGFTALLDVLEILKMIHKNSICEANWAKGFELKINLAPSFDIGFGDIEGLGL